MRHSLLSYAALGVLLAMVTRGAGAADIPVPARYGTLSPPCLSADCCTMRSNPDEYARRPLPMTHHGIALPTTIESMSMIAEEATFRFRAVTGELRERIIIPMRKCTRATQTEQGLLFNEPDLFMTSPGKPWGNKPQPDNPWFVLAYPRCGPPGANCGVTPPSSPAMAAPALPLLTLPSYTYSTSPYEAEAAALPNPDNPSPVPHHSNITRHWANMTPDNPVQVIIACNTTAGLAAMTNIFPGPFATPGGPLTLIYTWQYWVSHIQATFGKFTNCPTAAVWVNTSAYYTDTVVPSGGYSASAAYTAYDLPAPAVLPFPAPLAPGAVGGHLLWDYSSSPIEPNGTGPTGNGYNEILFLRNRPLMNGGFCSMDIDPATGAILECDVIFDVRSFNGTPLNTPPSFTNAFRHEIGHFFGLDHTNLQPGSSTYAGFPSWMNFASPLAPGECPGMLAAITPFGIDMVNEPLHKDDATGLSRIYPVQVPDVGANKAPLINSTATIRGAVLDPQGNPRFGDNVFVLPRGWSDPMTTPPGAVVPQVGTVSGTARLLASDVVGFKNNRTGQRCSGSFEILGVPAGAIGAGGSGTYGTMYDVIAENHAFSLGGAARPSYGEWVYEPFLNATENAITLNDHQVRLYASGGQVGGGLPGFLSSWTSTPVVSSFSVVEGTVLDVGHIGHAGGPAASAVDTTSRPLLHISPRTRPPANGFVMLTCVSNYPLAVSSMSLTVNGIPFNLAAAPVATFTTAPVVSVTIPASLLLSTGAPARLVFTAREKVQPGSGLAFAVGRNEVQY